MNGILLIDKPAGITSFEVVRRVRRALKVKKVGHLGTLDPFATGLLPLALGEATKLAQFLLEEPKTYLATCTLGVETDTQDPTGRVIVTSEHVPAVDEIYQAAAQFVGEIEQTPPRYSAVHHEGERLYKLARRGVEVEAAPRKVTIYHLEVREVALPQVTFLVECGKGTYVRTLAYDLGRALGCGAHLVALIRLAVGSFQLGEAMPLAEAEQADTPEVSQRIIPLAQCLPRLQAVRLDEAQARRLSQGQALPWPENGLAEGEKVRVMTGESLVAVAAVRRERAQVLLAPVRVLGKFT